MTTLPTPIKLVSSSTRAPGTVWTGATKRKAPHKPLLLLAVLDLVHRGVITTPFIAVSGDLVGRLGSGLQSCKLVNGGV